MIRDMETVTPDILSPELIDRPSAGTAMLPASTRAAETRLAMTRRARAWVDFDTECSRGVERHGNVPGAIQ